MIAFQCTFQHRIPATEEIGCPTLGASLFLRLGWDRIGSLETLLLPGPQQLVARPALCQGTTSVVPQHPQKREGFSPG